ncbi:MAG: efflux RND transporter periplasmic adaptor subunit [Bryobacterales bacterium]|nr:efflux RND transporter periplasmic adaptor subunit [Bryobacterales bacterium]
MTVRDVPRVIESVGTLYPFEEVTISSEIEGRILEVNADLGDRVEAGALLVRISDEEQRYMLAQNEAQLRQVLERLGLSGEDDTVKDIRDAPEVRSAQAELKGAEQRYKRINELVEQGIGSRQEFDEARSRYDTRRAAYDVALNQVRNLVQEKQRMRALVELQRKKLRDTKVLAPFAAHVNERKVNVGQFVSANTALFSLVKIDPIRLRIDVPERMAPWVRTGQPIEVSMEAFAGHTFRGKIWRISPTVDSSKRTFVIEALIDNPAGALKPGSYAKASIRTEKIESLQLVPAAGVAYIYGSNKVYVVQDGVVEARDVKIGDRLGDLLEITEGLTGTESVAVTQINRLDTGARVEVAQR